MPFEYVDLIFSVTGYPFLIERVDLQLTVSQTCLIQEITNIKTPKSDTKETAMSPCGLFC